MSSSWDCIVTSLLRSLLSIWLEGVRDFTGNLIDRYRDYISVPELSVYRLVMLRDDDTRGALTLKLDHEEG